MHMHERTNTHALVPKSLQSLHLDRNSFCLSFVFVTHFASHFLSLLLLCNCDILSQVGGLVLRISTVEAPVIPAKSMSLCLLRSLVYSKKNNNKKNPTTLMVLENLKRIAILSTPASLKAERGMLCKYAFSWSFYAPESPS